MKRICLYILCVFMFEYSYAQTANGMIRRQSNRVKPHSSSVKPKPPKKSTRSVKPNNSTTSSVNTSKRGDETIIVRGVSYKMIGVQGGTFSMGATTEQGTDAYDVEKPVHLVTLSSFSIGETEVTQELWQAVMGSNPSKFKGPHLPVEQVSWNDCQTFISKLNSLTGRCFRLPTEAEWEYAARGGRKGNIFKYSGSNNIDDIAWYSNNGNSQTHKVATKKANELGLYDMTGNVWEWCLDKYDVYSSDNQTNPVGPLTGSNHLYRGGCWFSKPQACRVSYRNSYIPSYSFDGLGLRLAY